MLNKSYRFHGLGSLNRVYNKGRTVRAGEISIKFWLNERRDTFRVAVVVSKKVHKSAVVRNRIRRRIFEIVRTNTFIDKPYDIIISVFDDGVASKDAQNLTQQVIQLIDKTGISTKAQ